MENNEYIPQTDKAQIQLNPIPEKEKMRMIEGNKGLFLAIVLGVVVVIIGASALIGFKSGSQYQGLIKKIESQTEQLQSSNASIVR